MNKTWVDFWSARGFKIEPETNGQLLIYKGVNSRAILNVSTVHWSLTLMKSSGEFGINRKCESYNGTLDNPARELYDAWCKFTAFME